ncbi:hypothetical protein CEXT_674911, partial [Caerostris extrusa]
SGPGKAYQIFKERVIPLFVESDTQYEVLITDRANCARDFMKKADVSQWDGIVVVSGDGLLFEPESLLVELREEDSNPQNITIGNIRSKLW